MYYPNVTNYRTRINPFNLLNTATFVLVFNDNEFRFTDKGFVCCELNNIIDMILLRKDIVNLALSTARHILTIVLKLSAPDPPSRSIPTSNIELIQTTQSLQYKSLELFQAISPDDQNSDAVPSLVYDRSAPLQPSSHILQYYELLGLLESSEANVSPPKTRVKRFEIADELFFGGRLRQTQENEKIFQNNFQKSSINQHRLLKNQENLYRAEMVNYNNSLALEHNLLNLHDSLLEMSIDLSINKREVYRQAHLLSLASRLDGLFLYHKEMLQETVSAISDLLNSGPGKCEIFSNIVTCPISRPLITIDRDIIRISNSRLLEYAPQVYVQCLETNNGRFIAHNKTFIKQGDNYHDSSGLIVAGSCFTSIDSCSDSYSPVPMSDKILNNCTYIYNLQEVYVACPSQTLVSDKFGETLQLTRKPTKLPIDSFPIKTSDGKQFNINDIELFELESAIYDSHFATATKSEVNYFINFQAFNPKVVKPEESLSDQLYEFGQMNEIEAGHVVSLTLIVVILCLLTCILCIVCRYETVRKSFSYFLCSPCIFLRTACSRVNTSFLPSVTFRNGNVNIGHPDQQQQVDNQGDNPDQQNNDNTDGQGDRQNDRGSDGHNNDYSPGTLFSNEEDPPRTFSSETSCKRGPGNQGHGTNKARTQTTVAPELTPGQQKRAAFSFQASNMKLRSSIGHGSNTSPVATTSLTTTAGKPLTASRTASNIMNASYEVKFD